MRRSPLALLLLATAGPLLAQRTPEEAQQALRLGNQRFAEQRSLAQPAGEGVRRTLARGESPFAIVVGCADSDAPPEHVFNVGLGELQVVRSAGHAVDAETIASIEHAVEHLGVPLCVVLAHEGCGAIGTAIDQVLAPTQRPASSPAMQLLLERIEPAVRKARQLELTGTTLHTASEEEQAQTTVTECLRRSDLLRRYAAVGRFRMVAARYHASTGQVEWLPIRPLPSESSQRDPIPAGSVPNGVPPHVALRFLQAGHRRFLSDQKPSANLTAERRATVAEGAVPHVVVLTCADSRVSPEHVFDAGLGELCVIRTAGNTLSDHALASIEQAAGTHGAALLVVLGHSKCGMVQAAIDDPARANLSPNTRLLLQRIEPSVGEARRRSRGKHLLELATAANAQRMVTEARSRSVLLRELEARGRFAMLAGVYDLASGDIEWLHDGEGHAAVAPRATPPVAVATHTGPAASHGEHGAGPRDDRGHDSHGAAPAPHGEVAPHGKGAGKAEVPHGSHDAHGAPEPAAPHADEGHGAASHQGGGDAHPGPAGPRTEHGHDQHDGHGQPHGGKGSSHAHGGSGSLPVLDWASGGIPAAPSGHGESTTSHHATTEDHGSADPHVAPGEPDAHDKHDGHDKHDAHAKHGSHPDHATDGAHGEPAAHGSPARPASPASHAAHGDHHGESHGSPDAHGHDHAAAKGHDDHPHPPSDKSQTLGWNEPIVLVGISGVVSLLVAAILAMRKR